MTITLSGQRWMAVLFFVLTLSDARAQQDERNTSTTTPAATAEIDLPLPAAPKKENLLPFYVSATTTMNFALDGQSVSVDSDGVVRYVVVVTSRAGATNTSYEGIRCPTGEKKLIALGQADGSWSRARRDRWEPITEAGGNRQHAALALEYFCEGGRVAGKAETIVERLRRKKPLK